MMTKPKLSAAIASATITAIVRRRASLLVPITLALWVLGPWVEVPVACVVDGIAEIWS